MTKTTKRANPLKEIEIQIDGQTFPGVILERDNNGIVKIRVFDPEFIIENPAGYTQYEEFKVGDIVRFKAIDEFKIGVITEIDSEESDLPYLIQEVNSDDDYWCSGDRNSEDFWKIVQKL